MYPMPILPGHPPLQNHPLHPLHPPHPHCPSPTSCWLASNVVWQCQWPRAATLALSTAPPSASASAGSTDGSTAHQPMVLERPQTSILTLGDPVAMHEQMGVHTPNTAPKS